MAEPLSKGTWTVFAPTDEAFGAIEDAAETFDFLDLDDMLQFHAVAGARITFADLPCTELTEMANGETSRTKCSRNGTIKYQRGPGQMDGMLPKIVAKDVEVCNGIIHVVDNVMLPNFEDK